MVNQEIVVDHGKEILGQHFSESESKILASVLQDEESSLDVIIPEQMDPDALWASLETCSKMNRIVTTAGAKIKPALGRMLIVLRQYPALYLSRGYKNYDDFLSRGMEELFGICRSEAYNCIGIAETFPQITQKEFCEIGVSKLQIAARAVRENPNCVDTVLEVAKQPEMNVSSFKSYVAELTGRDVRDFDYEEIKIITSKSIAEHWNHFIRNKYVQQIVGSDRPGEILECMMGECLPEWEAQARIMPRR